jgi:hypothetical protein
LAAPKPEVSESEFEVLEILWQSGSGKARDVFESLRERGSGWTYATVLTLLRRLEARVTSAPTSEFAHVFGRRSRASGCSGSDCAVWPLLRRRNDSTVLRSRGSRLPKKSPSAYLPTELEKEARRNRGPGNAVVAFPNAVTCISDRCRWQRAD